ncbi:hypothetical protein GYMLUDRAFT_250954 [Collybiopsis luxurians FD-317 M1]|uniref:Uncharacterized protein n=1 Tax=Collybiopsis luxurians FD-317 M1 TaxID=944289 RepID=A0A0D0BSU4_9AGAR|nr:hypothetical protein GYMLUDRAFT_250954 [Collybiopsis luxurians FD-317 M1]
MKRLGESSVTQVIARDGSVYFLVMLVVGITTTIADIVQLQTETDNTFLLVISPFFSIRLMLNLRTFSNPEEMSRFSQSAEGQQNSGLQFATNSFLGNIGAPLDGGSMNDEGEEQEEQEYVKE